MPLLIPYNNRKLQYSLALVVLYLLTSRVLNILVPYQMGIVADRLLAKETPVDSLSLWLLLSLLNSESGLGLIMDSAKTPIKQFSYQKITHAIFAHVMTLPMEFHVENDSAQVLKTMGEGWALAHILERLAIDIVPVCVDLAVALVLLYQKFNIQMSLGMLMASAAYISVQITTARWNADALRRMIDVERKETRAMRQAVQGWQTVSYFNMFSFERARHAEAVEQSLAASREWSRRTGYSQAVQKSLLPISFFALSRLVFREISRGRATYGDYMFFTQYWASLVSPLTMLSQNYRWLMNDLMGAERLLDLLQAKPSVVDEEKATDLGYVTGSISFENVGFSYGSGPPVLRHVSFTVAAGETVALVGMSGAGKSTIVRLLLRLYDVRSGRIRVDGRDVRSVTLSSLRGAFGVVPQDPWLFNASIMDNVRYARLAATNDEVFDACRRASIHDRITGFPDGYGTKVVEQGVKLSGGEAQRLAIARALLRDAPILVLDEASSAVDAETETDIRGFLRAVRGGRTVLMIAHRLSTVVESDKIMVVHEGEIAESGTHHELLAASSKYRSLWAASAGKLKEQ